MTWFVITTAPRQESRVISDLKEQGIEAWTPQERRWRHIGRRKVESGSPLFAGYVFVSLPTGRFDVVREVEGVGGFVHSSGHPATISATWVALVQRAERLGLFDRTVAPWRYRRIRRQVFGIGDTVRIIGDGPDAGLVGKVIKGGTKAEPKLSIGRFIATVEATRLEPVREAA